MCMYVSELFHCCCIVRKVRRVEYVSWVDWMGARAEQCEVDWGDSVDYGLGVVMWSRSLIKNISSISNISSIRCQSVWKEPARRLGRLEDRLSRAQRRRRVCLAARGFEAAERRPGDGGRLDGSYAAPSFSQIKCTS